MSDFEPLPLCSAFIVQFTGVENWLDVVLHNAGVKGAPAKRARARIAELRDEVTDISTLIAAAKTGKDFSKLTEYEDFDATHLFGAELAKRADSGIQDLGSAIWDELSGMARARKKELAAQLPTPVSTGTEASNPQAGSSGTPSSTLPDASKSAPRPTVLSVDEKTLAIWHDMSACDCIEEIGATVMRLAEAARYLFQTEFLRAVILPSNTPAQ